MAVHDPQMRVATSGTDAVGKNYSRTTPATVGFVLTAQGEELPPIWAAGIGASPLFVTAVYFVDTRNVGAADGSLTNPFPTIQGAIDRVDTDAVNSAIIMIAPGTYVENPTVPLALNLSVLVFQSWYQPQTSSAPGTLPLITGNLTITEGGPGAARAIELNGILLNGNIAPANPAHSLSIRLQASRVGGSITAATIGLYLHQSSFGNRSAITATTTLVIRTDGFSWSNLVEEIVALSPVDYTRQFYDTGADETDDQNLFASQLAIGTMDICECDYLGARPGEYAIASLTADPAPVDFSFGFHHTETDKVFFWLRNESRGGMDFDEPVNIVVFHGGMAKIQQAPP